MNLIDIVRTYTSICAPEEGDVDMIFFGVKVLGNCPIETLKSEILAYPGMYLIYTDGNLLDRKEHGLFELEKWVGDRDLALRLMALGEQAGLWQLFTPKMMGVNMAAANNLARDMLSIQVVQPQ